MFANWPPFGLVQVQTFGGKDPDGMLIRAAPEIEFWRRCRRAIAPRKIHMVENGEFAEGRSRHTRKAIAHIRVIAVKSAFGPGPQRVASLALTRRSRR